MTVRDGKQAYDGGDMCQWDINNHWPIEVALLVMAGDSVNGLLHHCHHDSRLRELMGFGAPLIVDMSCDYWWVTDGKGTRRQDTCRVRYLAGARRSIPASFGPRTRIFHTKIWPPKGIDLNFRQRHPYRYRTTSKIPSTIFNMSINCTIAGATIEFSAIFDYSWCHQWLESRTQHMQYGIVNCLDAVRIRFEQNLTKLPNRTILRRNEPEKVLQIVINTQT